MMMEAKIRVKAAPMHSPVEQVNERMYKLNPEFFRVDEFGEAKYLVLRHVETEAPPRPVMEEFFMGWCKDRGLDLDRMEDIILEEVEAQMLGKILIDRLLGR
jgi:hypothetical protein